MRIAHLIEPELGPNVHGWRRRHSVRTAIEHIASLEGRRFGFDIQRFFVNIDQRTLKRKLDRLEPTVWGDIERWLPEHHLQEGAAFNPALANLYLAEVDRRFPMAVRYCDNIMIVDPDPERVFVRLRKQLSDLGLACHDEQADPIRFCKNPLPAVRRPPTRVGLPVTHRSAE